MIIHSGSGTSLETIFTRIGTIRTMIAGKLPPKHYFHAVRLLCRQLQRFDDMLRAKISGVYEQLIA